MRIRHAITVFVLTSLLPTGDADRLRADDRPPTEPSEPLVTDRPDFTESPEPVPPGRVQLEGGVTFTYDHESPSRSASFAAPEFLLRIGIVDALELRIGWEGYTWLKERLPEKTESGRTVHRDEWSQGASDLYLGAKWKIADQSGLRPHLSLIPAITAPSGTISFSSGDVDPELKIAWCYDLTDGLSLSGNANGAAPTDERGRFFQAGASVSLGLGLTESLGVYVEYYGTYPNTRESDCSHSVDAGVTLQLTEDLQLDWRAGFGLNEEADDFFTGAGFGLRF